MARKIKLAIKKIKIDNQQFFKEDFIDLLSIVIKNLGAFKR